MAIMNLWALSVSPVSCREDCTCDDFFRRCLTRLESGGGDSAQLAAVIREWYFNSGKMYCIKECPNFA